MVLRRRIFFGVETGSASTVASCEEKSIIQFEENALKENRRQLRLKATTQNAKSNESTTNSVLMEMSFSRIPKPAFQSEHPFAHAKSLTCCIDRERSRSRSRNTSRFLRGSASFTLLPLIYFIFFSTNKSHSYTILILFSKVHN